MKKEWSDMMAQFEEDPDSIINDNDGPNKERPRRFLVMKGKELRFRNQQANVKTVQATLTTKKNATKDEVDAMKVKALHDHEIGLGGQNHA